MGKGMKLTVRAQRKYAHKAYIPGLPCKSDAEPQEVDQPTPPPPVLMRTRKNVNDLLNQVAFQNVHPHAEDQKLKDVRVVLKRLSPQRSAAVRVVRRRPENRQENETAPSPKDSLPNKVESADSKNKTKNSNSKGKPKPNQKKNYIKLRNRIIVTKCPPKEQEKRGNKIRSASETSEDNKPLTFYARTASQSKVIKRKGRKVGKIGTGLSSLSLRKVREQKIRMSMDLSPASNTRRLTRRADLQQMISKKNCRLRTKASRPPEENNKKIRSRTSVSPVRPENLKQFSFIESIPTEAKLTRRSCRVKSIVKSVNSVDRKKRNYSSTDREETRSHSSVSSARVKKAKKSKMTKSIPPKGKITRRSWRRAQSLARAIVNALKIGDQNSQIVPTNIVEIRSSSPSLTEDALPVVVMSNAVPESQPQSRRVSESNDIQETIEQQKNKNESQQNPLADFVIKIFNCDVTENKGDEESNVTESPLARVQEWLVKSNPHSTDDGQFKVPAIPRQAGAVSPSIASASVVKVITIKEQALRSRCTAWNYKSLSDVVEKKSLIKMFCGVCTRCVVMFTPEFLQSSMRNSMPKAPATSDVYEFTVDRDDVTHDFQESFFKIAAEADHVTNLKQVMTEKGRKIFKAAIIVKEKIEANEPLEPKEHTILAQVIGILNQCNAARMQDTQIPDNTKGQRFMFFEEEVSIATSSKLQRLESLRQSSPVPLRESKNFWPTQNEFKESPIKFACKIKQNHPGISLCGIIPPHIFKPTCNVGSLEMNFKISNQYIHRMLNRWGEATRQLTAIRSIQDPKIQRSPLFEGLEVDLVKLFHTVQSENGIEACQNNNEKWQIIAQKMKLHCRGKVDTKLENIYLKYLLSYNTLTPDERDKANAAVQKCWANREIASVVRAQQPLWRQERMRQGVPIDDDEVSSHLEKVCAEAEECVTPGRNTNYKSFQKLGMQVQKTYFPDFPTPSTEEVEQKFWDIVMSANAHVCVHAASVDAAEHGSGFTEDQTEPFGSHPWNLKRLCWSSDNLLSYLGPSLGVSSTSIHYGMMFSTSCWHMDPTSVPWIEYLHSGPPKIWYTISANQEQTFRAAAEALCPFAVQNKDIWLPCDIIMIPPNLLRQYGITVDRHVQHPGEFVVVYPNTYCACIDTGLTISEGVYFAPHDWIMDVERIFLNLRNSCEPSLFSMEKLLIAMACNDNTPYSLLQRVHTVLTSLLCAELSYRQAMADRNIELMSPQVFLEQNQRASSSSWQIQQSGECVYCRCHLHLSRVVGVTEGQTGACAMHGIQLFDSAVSRQVQLTKVYCIMLITNAGIYDIINTLKQRMMGSIRAAI